MKLRYTGTAPTTLMAQGRELQPDEEFDVSEEEAEGFVSREDMQEVPPPRKTSKAPAKRAESAPEADKPAAQAPDNNVTN